MISGCCRPDSACSCRLWPFPCPFTLPAALIACFRALAAGNGTRCGSCRPACPENCIETGDPVFRIRQENCLQCGACAEACPRGAIERVGD